MKPKPKVTCPVCGLVVALNTNGLLPRHKPRWRDGAHSVDGPVCFASYKPPQEAEAAMDKYEAEMSQ